MNTTTTTASLHITFQGDATNPQGFEFTSPAFDTEAERDAWASQFPKGCNLKPQTVSSFTTAPYTTFTYYRSAAHANLAANKANGGVNESGVKRLKAILRACDKLGIEVTYVTPFTNSFADLDAALAAIDA